MLLSCYLLQTRFKARQRSPQRRRPLVADSRAPTTSWEPCGSADRTREMERLEFRVCGGARPQGANARREVWFRAPAGLFGTCRCGVERARNVSITNSEPLTPRQAIRNSGDHTLCDPRRSLAFRRYDHAIQLIGIALEVVGCANVIATVRRGAMDDFRRRNGNPGAVDLHLVVIVDRAAGRRTAVGEITTRALAVGSLQGVVKALMPLVVAGAEVPLLCLCVS